MLWKEFSSGSRETLSLPLRCVLSASYLSSLSLGFLISNVEMMIYIC